MTGSKKLKKINKKLEEKNNEHETAEIYHKAATRGVKDTKQILHCIDCHLN